MQFWLDSAWWNGVRLSGLAIGVPRVVSLPMSACLWQLMHLAALAPVKALWQAKQSVPSA